MAARSGMPSRLSNFVGRKKELAELRRLLPRTRLLTLLGPGGSGKTRLAIEFVRQRESRFPEVAAFAELGDITNGALIVEAIARASGVRLEGRDHLGSLIRGLQSHRLLVLDNCEHLVEHAAQVATDLLIGCPQLTLIATSRERMNVEAEHIYLVPPLGVPAGGMDVATADSSDAARLFIDRARSVRPGFLVNTSNAVAVLTICRRLEGMPLAIELAAARLTTLSPHDIVPRLEDSLRLLTRGSRGGASRQQTLRAALEWARRDPEVEQEMLGGLYLVWMVNAPREGFERINDALRRVAPNPSKGFLRAGHAWDALGGITGLRWDGTPIAVRLIELVGKS